MQSKPIFEPLFSEWCRSLYGLRRNSKTFGLINTIFAGRYRLWEVLIPPGGGHGYKALGLEPIQLVYFTDRHYNPFDEFRIVYNHHAVAYDWENAAQISSCAF